MSDLTVFHAEERTRAGKGAARAARRDGHVPGVVYGGNEAPLLVNLDPKALNRELHRPGFFSHQFLIKVGDKEQKALARDVQFHPVTDAPLHIDFLRVTDRTRVTVHIPVHFVDEEKSRGLRRGGVLNIVRHDVEVVAMAGNIPDDIVISLAGKDINDSIHISEVTLPQGVKPTITDRDFTIATIAPPSGGAEDEAVGGDVEMASDDDDESGDEDEGENKGE